MDGKALAQCNGINRYVGKMSNLYPDDPWQAALCDEIMDAVEDIAVKLVATFTIQDDDELKAARQALADGPLTFYLERIQNRLAANGGTFFADNRLTVADLKVFAWIRHLKSGNLEHVPADLADRVAPQTGRALRAHQERVRCQGLLRQARRELRDCRNSQLCYQSKSP